MITDLPMLNSPNVPQRNPKSYYNQTSNIQCFKWCNVVKFTTIQISFGGKAVNPVNIKKLKWKKIVVRKSFFKIQL